MSLPSFGALRDMHNSANDLLHSAEIQQFLINHKQERWVQEVAEASLRTLDICGISKDALLLVRDHIRGLQSTLRRTSVKEASIPSMIEAYTAYRKKLKKETAKCLLSLKNKPLISSDVAPTDENLIVVGEVLRQVRLTTISIVGSLLSLVSIPWLDQKSSKGHSLKSKFMLLHGNGAVHDFCYGTAVHSARKRLEAVEITVRDLEVEIQSMFRRLIQTRVLLLNIIGRS